MKKIFKNNKFFIVILILMFLIILSSIFIFKNNKINNTQYKAIINNESISLKSGETFPLKKLAMYKAESYKSENEKIATVTSTGALKGIKAGTTRIQKINNNQVTGYINVNVDYKDTSLKSITSDEFKLNETLNKNTYNYTAETISDSINLKIEATDSSSQIKIIDESLNNKSKTGTLLWEQKKPGTYTIEVTNGTYKSTYKLDVKKVDSFDTSLSSITSTSKGFNINFSPEITNYTTEISDDSIYIKATTQDPSATVKICEQNSSNCQSSTKTSTIQSNFNNTLSKIFIITVNNENNENAYTVTVNKKEIVDIPTCQDVTIVRTNNDINFANLNIIPNENVISWDWAINNTYNDNKGLISWVTSKANLKGTQIVSLEYANNLSKRIGKITLNNNIGSTTCYTSEYILQEKKVSSSSASTSRIPTSSSIKISKPSTKPSSSKNNNNTKEKNDTTITKVTATTSGHNQKVTKSGKTYTVEIDNQTTKLKIKIKTKNNKAKITAPKELKNKVQEYSKIKEGTTTKKITVKSENGKETEKYKVKIERQKAKPTGTFLWPVPSSSKVSGWYGSYKGHKGNDIAAKYGTAVVAADGGTVVSVHTGCNPKTKNSSCGSGWGNYIKIKHTNKYSTQYNHLSKISVKKGQKVAQGTKIGEVGNSGNSNGSHLDFEIYKNGTRISARNLIKYNKTIKY